MAWFKKVRKPIESANKESRVPEGLWVKCPSCAQIIYNKDLAASLSVCTKCSHHFRLGATDRLRSLFDGSWTEHDAGVRSTDPLRFTDTKVADRTGDALRMLFWSDFPGWNATTAAHPWPFHFLAPNLDLNVQFHRFAPEAEWILADGVVPLAADGLVGCTSRLWTEDGRLLATALSKHLCRPNPRYAEELARARELGLLPSE